MKKLLVIAWRSLWRNKRRTLLTISSIVFAIFFAVLMQSQQYGTYDNAIKNIINLETGHIQIMGKGYNETKSIDDAIFYDTLLFNMLNQNPEIEKTVVRVENFGMASTGDFTKETAIMGIEIAKEGKTFARSIKAGTMINDSSTGVVVGEILAKFLKIIEYDTELELKDKEGKIERKIITNDTARWVVGQKYDEKFTISAVNSIPRMVKDSIVVIGIGYQGATAAAVFHVDGIMRLPLPDMNKRLVLMNIATSQKFVQAAGLLSTVNIYLKNNEKLQEVGAQLKATVDKEKYDVFKWSDLKEELVQQIESDKKSGLLFMLILYLIIGFGILGTIIMMAHERKKEFAVMVALGMKKKLLVFTIIVENFFIAIIGSIGGVMVSTPLILYLHLNPIRLTGDMAKALEDMGWEPIIPYSVDYQIFVNQALIILFLFACASFYTLFKIKNLNVIASIRG